MAVFVWRDQIKSRIGLVWLNNIQAEIWIQKLLSAKQEGCYLDSDMLLTYHSYLSSRARDSQQLIQRWHMSASVYVIKVIGNAASVPNKLSIMSSRHMGEWRYSSIILDLGTGWWTWVVSFTFHPLYPRVKSPRCPSYRGLGGAQSWYGRCVEEENSCRKWTPAAQPLARCHTDWTIPCLL
jgi:hypothetical protein